MLRRLGQEQEPVLVLAQVVLVLAPNRLAVVQHRL